MANEENTVNNIKAKIEKGKEVKKMPHYLRYVKDVFSSKEPINEEDAKYDNKTRREGIRNLWAYSYEDERIKIPWKDMSFENWIKEVVMVSTEIMAEIDTDGCARGAT
ncbi:hypothetical protein Tco_0586311 [Tanacetum coccineum]